MCIQDYGLTLVKISAGAAIKLQLTIRLERRTDDTTPG